MSQWRTPMPVMVPFLDGSDLCYNDADSVLIQNGNLILCRGACGNNPTAYLDEFPLHEVNVAEVMNEGILTKRVVAADHPQDPRADDEESR
jgi:hypothetical protein